MKKSSIYDKILLTSFPNASAQITNIIYAVKNGRLEIFMAVQPSDDRFDWCSRLIKARRNYSAAECCDILKNQLATFRGADPGYVSKVRSYQTKDFSIVTRYIPIYEATATVTYTWNTTDEKKTTVKISDGPLDTSPEYVKLSADVKTTHRQQLTFTKLIFANVADELRPTEFVGRNDQRFEALSHVDDLQGQMWTPHSVYSSGAMENAIISEAKKEHQGQVTLNKWSCTAILIPAFEITVPYNGRRDIWYVNAHNGASRCTGYLVSNRIEKAADETAQKVKLPHIISYIAGIASMIVSVTTMNWLGAWFATLLSLIISFSCGIVAINESRKQTKYSIRARFGKEGDCSRDEYSGALFCMWMALGALIFAVICAVIW